MAKNDKKAEKGAAKSAAKRLALPMATIPKKRPRKAATTEGGNPAKRSKVEKGGIRGLSGGGGKPEKTKRKKSRELDEDSVIPDPERRDDCEVAVITRKYDSVTDYLAGEPLDSFKELNLRFISRQIDDVFKASELGPSIGLVYSVVHLFANVKTFEQGRDFALLIVHDKRGDDSRLKVAKKFHGCYDYRHETDSGRLFAVKSGTFATRRLQRALKQGNGGGQLVMARFLCKLVDARFGKASIRQRRDWLGDLAVEYAKMPDNYKWKRIWKQKLVLPTEFKDAYPFGVETDVGSGEVDESVDTDDDDDEYKRVVRHKEKEAELENCGRSIRRRINALKQTITETRSNIEERNRDTLVLSKHCEEMETELVTLEERLPIVEREQQLERNFIMLFGKSAKSDPAPFLEALEKLRQLQAAARARNEKVKVDLREIFISLTKSFGRDPSHINFTWGSKEATGQEFDANQNVGKGNGVNDGAGGGGNGASNKPGGEVLDEDPGSAKGNDQTTENA